jgi:hypothetical protein
MVDLTILISLHFLFNLNFCVSQIWPENDIKDCLEINDETMTFLLEFPSHQRDKFLVPFLKPVCNQKWSEEDQRSKRMMEEHSSEDLIPFFLLDLVEYFELKKLIIFIQPSNCMRLI